MSKHHSLRFSVTDGVKKASTWTITSHKKKPEVYIFNRLMGSIHVSFHGSGKWHVKFGDIEEKRRVSVGQDVTDAYLTKWQRPEPTVKGITVAFRIITAWGALQKPRRRDDKKFIAIPNAAEGLATQVMVMFAPDSKELVVHNATLIGVLPVSSGERVHVYYAYVSAEQWKPAVPTKIGSFAHNVKLLDLFYGNFGMIVHGDVSDGSKALWDIAIHIKPLAYVKILLSKARAVLFRK